MTDKIGLELQPSGVSGEGAASSACYSLWLLAALCKMGNHTYRRVNKQGHGAWIPPTQGIACPRVASCWEVNERCLTKPIPQIRQQQKCGAVLARLREDGYVQAQACVESGMGAAVVLWESYPNWWWEVQPKTFINQTLCSRIWEVEGMLSRSLDWTFCHILCHLPGSKW